MLTMLGTESTTSCRLRSKTPGPMKTTPQVIFDYYSHRDISDTTVCPTQSNKLATRPNVSPKQYHPSIRATLPSTHRLFTSASNSPRLSRPPVPSSPPSPPSSLSVGYAFRTASPNVHGLPRRLTPATLTCYKNIIIYYKLYIYIYSSRVHVQKQGVHHLPRRLHRLLRHHPPRRLRRLPQSAPPPPITSYHTISHTPNHTSYHAIPHRIRNFNAPRPRREPSSSPRHEGAGPPSTLGGGGSCLKPHMCV
jgi:hypothetical protein